MSKILKYQSIGSKAAKKLCVLLHGYGSHGGDTLMIASFMQQNLGDVYFICPDAPHPWEGGYSTGKQWFSLATREEKILYDHLETANKVLTLNIKLWLSEVGLSLNDLFLGGFSQGAMLALYAGIRFPQKISGILGLSGTFIGHTSLHVDIRSRPDICMIHGEYDDVLPITYAKLAQKSFENSGLPSTLHVIKNLGHSVNEEVIELACKFAKERM